MPAVEASEGEGEEWAEKERLPVRNPVVKGTACARGAPRSSARETTGGRNERGRALRYFGGERSP
jgi:hypothetical protein